MLPNLTTQRTSVAIHVVIGFLAVAVAGSRAPGHDHDQAGAVADPSGVAGGVETVDAGAGAGGALQARAAATLPADPMGGELPLRLWAQRRGIHFGTAINHRAVVTDERYRWLAGREFSMLTPENAMKMGPLRPSREQFSWDQADAIVRFAERHAQQVHGHALVWHEQNPRWLTEGDWTRETLLEVMREHITEVVGRYRGRVQVWDVVNEAVDEDGSLRDTLWLRVIGPDYIEHAFRWAHEADPAAVLLYNDYNAEDLGTKSDGVHELLADLVGRGVPVHGVGLQMHLTAGMTPTADDFRGNLRRLADLGLELHVTEADVRMRLPATADRLRQQAEDYRRMLEIALEQPAFRSWTIWGFTDLYSWVPRRFEGHGAALPWDEDYQPKPARAALVEALRGSAVEPDSEGDSGRARRP